MSFLCVTSMMGVNPNCSNSMSTEVPGNLLPDSGNREAPWSALRGGIQDYYTIGDVIAEPSELINEIERINNALYAKMDWKPARYRDS